MKILEKCKLLLPQPTIQEAMWFFIASCIFFFLFLGSHPLLLPDEGRYSEVAREMLASGNFITPHLNDTIFFHKPILFYWLQTVSFSLFGINPWSIRFFPALFGIFSIIFIYWTSSLLLGRHIGRMSAMILATTPLYFGAAHYANLDLEVAVWINACLLSLLVGIVRNKNAWLYAAYIFAGLAFLTKGLIGLFFPVATIGLWIMLTHQWKLIKKLKLIQGLILIILITAPWLICVSYKNPDFLKVFFYQQQFQRFTGKNFNSHQGWWFYIMVISAGFLPWTYFLIRYIKQLYQISQKNNIVLYLTIWAVIVLLFFSIPSSKLVGYILPIFAPLAILTAIILEKIALSKKTFNRLMILMIISTLMIIYSIQYLPTKLMKSTRALVTYIPSNIPPLSIVSYHFYFQDLPLYSQQPVRVVYHWQSIHGDNWASELAYASKADPNQQQRLLNEEAFWKLWQQDKPLYVFLRDSDLRGFKQYAQNFRIIAESDHILLLTQT